MTTRPDRIREPVGAELTYEGFHACANCARVARYCVCAGTSVAPDIRFYTGLLTRRRPFTEAEQRRLVTAPMTGRARTAEST